MVAQTSRVLEDGEKGSNARRVLRVEPILQRFCA